MFYPLHDDAPEFEAFLKELGDIKLGDGKHENHRWGYSWCHDVFLNGEKIGIFTECYEKHELASKAFGGRIPGHTRPDNGSENILLYFDVKTGKRVDAHTTIPF